MKFTVSMKILYGNFVCESCFLGNGKSARSFADRSFLMDVRVGCPFRNACFFQDLEGLTEVFGGMSAGTSRPKLPLWAEFLFLIFWSVGIPDYPT